MVQGNIIQSRIYNQAELDYSRFGFIYVENCLDYFPNLNPRYIVKYASINFYNHDEIITVTRQAYKDFKTCIRSIPIHNKKII